MGKNIKPTFTRRIKALLIDYCLIVGYIALLIGCMSLVYLATGSIPNWLEHGTTTAQLLGFLTLVLPVGIYLFLSETSKHQATVGKRAMRLIVIASHENTKLSGTRVLVRTIVKLLPWEVAHFFVWHLFAILNSEQAVYPGWLDIGLTISLVIPLIYVLVVALQPQGRGPHDLIAGTKVIFKEF